MFDVRFLVCARFFFNLNNNKIVSSFQQSLNIMKELLIYYETKRIRERKEQTEY